MESLTNYIDKGGIIFLVLLGISIFTFGVVIYKVIEYFFFNRLKLFSLKENLDNYTSFDDLKNEIISYQNEMQKSFIIDLFKAVEMDRKTDSNNNTKSFLEDEFQKSERFLPSLEIISQTSPLIGLLGTVIGMIDSFNQLELGGSVVDPSVLAGGIWTALLTTAMGLIVAIPALVFYYFFDKKISNDQNKIESAALRILKLN